MVNAGDEHWELPKGFIEKVSRYKKLENQFPMISLEPIEVGDGQQIGCIALEGDLHDIPSIRAMVKEDIEIVKEHVKGQLKEALPGLENGAFIALKEAFKRTLPNEYKVLKELKDVITR